MEFPREADEAVRAPPLRRADAQRPGWTGEYAPEGLGAPYAPGTGAVPGLDAPDCLGLPGPVLQAVTRPAAAIRRMAQTKRRIGFPPAWILRGSHKTKQREVHFAEIRANAPESRLEDRSLVIGLPGRRHRKADEDAAWCVHARTKAKRSAQRCRASGKPQVRPGQKPCPPTNEASPGRHPSGACVKTLN